MSMTCRDFDRAWNDLLDLRGEPAPEIESALAAHAASCPPCRDRAAGYEALRLGLADWSRPGAAGGPEVDAPLAARILDAWQAEAAPADPPARVVPYRRVAAVAAALVVAIGLWLLARPGARQPASVAPLAAGSPVRPLSESLADATAATLDLARETSAPATRLGRLALASAGPAAPGEPRPGPEAAGPIWVSVALPDSVVPSAEVIQSVGAGLRPLSGSARHAFGFLLGPATAPSPPGPRSPGA